MRAWALLAALAPAAAGCSARAASSPGPDKGVACDVLADEASYRRLFHSLHAGELPPPEPPPVDFGRRIVLFVSLGEKPTAGWSVAIARTEARGNVLEATLAVREPEPGAVHAQVITRPYVLTAVERPAGVSRADFLGPRGETLCSRPVPRAAAPR